MQIALDTNILVYAEGMNDARRRDLALDLLERLPKESAGIPVQVLGELFSVLVRKAGRTATDARAAILRWHSLFPPIETPVGAMLAAADLAVANRISIWDAVLLATAAEKGCRLLLSEDMHDGFTWRGLTVSNPFSAERHPLLEALLA